MTLAPGVALAAASHSQALSAAWGLPFAGLLLSIALLPSVAPGLWHRHVGKITAAWALAWWLPCMAVLGVGPTAQSVLHTLLADYLPFMLLLAALFTVAGGIRIRGPSNGTPAFNTGLMAAGAALASVAGTTGASMLLIRPLLAANRGRRQAAHVVVFFIFIVGNAGGSLTPLGDPPLFIGFLQGIDFFWPARHLFQQTLFVTSTLLLIFFCIDSGCVRRERKPGAPAGVGFLQGLASLRFEGLKNLLLMGAVLGLVILSGTWKPGLSVPVAGVLLPLQAVVRDVGLLGIVLASLAVTPAGIRAANRFSWAPLQEVAQLFAGIFVTMVPVLALLQQGGSGPFAWVANAVTTADGQPIVLAYFWLSGGLSAFLDNAPTYLVFFHLAGGDPQLLMGERAATLAALSAGAVFMGAMTYIGNAPNLMVKAIAEQDGVRMPSFFGYMLWSIGVLLPLLGVMSLVWFSSP